MTNTKGLWQIRHTVVLLRILIGWHFLYEGVIKVYNPDWTSFGYLATAQGPLKPLFLTLTRDPFLGIADSLNCIALIVVGLTLITGVFERIGAMVGVLLLAMYYLAHPSFPWLQQVNVEGSYWFVNKNLIELVACILLYQYPTAQYFGLSSIWKKKNKLTEKEAI
ncbi:MAG: DoxX subfamily [Bacteroidota bacterium]